MSTELITLRPEQTYREAIELLTSHRVTGLPVVDEKGVLLGMLSEKDVLSECGSLEPHDASSARFLDSRIKYKKKVHAVPLKTPIDKITRILSGKSYRRLPIVDEKGVLHGIVTRRDLIRILYLRIELIRKGVAP